MGEMERRLCKYNIDVWKRTNEEEEEEEEDETSVNLVASMGVILNCGGGYMGDIHMYKKY